MIELTLRESQFLALLNKGAKPVEIAFHFGVHKSTVYNRVNRVKKKLQCLTLEKTIQMAMRLGLIPFGIKSINIPLLHHEFLMCMNETTDHWVKIRGYDTSSDLLFNFQSSHNL